MKLYSLLPSVEIIKQHKFVIIIVNIIIAVIIIIIIMIA